MEVAAIELHAAGGFVEMNDDDALTAGKLATIAGAGPLVTAALMLVSGVALTALWGGRRRARPSIRAQTPRSGARSRRRS